MDNVIQIGNTQRGLTRMDNDVYEALIGADLSRRDLKAAMVIHRLTAGYNVSEARIAACIIADMSGMDRTQASKAICSLIEQRVVYRVGGSRGKLGLAPVNAWNITKQLSEHTPAQSARIVSLSEHASAHNKDSKDNISSNEEIVTPAQSAKPKEKAKRKQAFGIAQLLADNPHKASENVLTGYLALRKTKRAPISEAVWKSINAELAKCAAFGITADQALTEALVAGWQGFKADWIVNRLGSPKPAATSRHTGFDQRDYSAGLIEREDGTNGF